MVERGCCKTTFNHFLRLPRIKMRKKDRMEKTIRKKHQRRKPSKKNHQRRKPLKKNHQEKELSGSVQTSVPSSDGFGVFCVFLMGFSCFPVVGCMRNRDQKSCPAGVCARETGKRVRSHAPPGSVHGKDGPGGI